MELQQLRYFLDAAQTEHITESAERLHIAQPALSQSIRRLEEDLGVKLFRTKGRNIALTECGRYFYEKLGPVLKQLDELPHKVRKMAELENDTLRLNVLAASELVAEAVIGFKSAHRDLNFKLMQTRGEEAMDLEISTDLPGDSRSDKNRFVFRERIFLAVPRAYAEEKFGGRDSISLREAEGEDFISMAGVKQFRYICDKFCAAAGIKPRVIFESESAYAVKNMIAANLGVGFWPEFSWGDCDAERVKLLALTDPDCCRDITVTCRTDRDKNDNARVFFEFLSKYFESKRK